jgi:hypothetical protein
MYSFDILPFFGPLPFAFGMTQVEVHALLGGPPGRKPADPLEGHQ